MEFSSQMDDLQLVFNLMDFVQFNSVLYGPKADQSY
tara:strand:+ start:499 stop:606 length:108 start_codon:yes stop_codon:yes gene_type:complete